MPHTRVLYLVTSDISARFLRGQLAFLIAQGWEVHVATRRSDPPAEFDEGVTVHEIGFVRDPDPFTDLRALVATTRLIRTIRPSVVNASTPKAGLIGMVAARICRVQKRVYVVRGLRFETATGRRRQLLRALERCATSCATDVVYNSASLARVAESERVVRRGKGQVLGGGSGNGIDPRRFDDLPPKRAARASLGLPLDEPVVGFVGRLTKDKGIVDLVDAFDGIPGITVMIVGDYEPGDPVPERTRRAIVASSNLHHIPWMTDTRTAYAAMDVLVFPSYREGLPNVPLEAQLCGVPVVAYAATGTVDAVSEQHGGVLIAPGDTASLRTSVSSLLRDDERRRRGGQAQRWVTSTFDQRRVWEALHDVMIRPSARR